MPNDGKKAQTPLASRLKQAQQNTLQKTDATSVGRCPERNHWIEIVLQDDEGEAIANERYLLVDPDGSEHQGNLDGNGFARVDGLSAGTCRVSFPNLFKQWQPAWTSHSEE